MSTNPEDHKQPMFAKPRNDDLEETELRARISKFTMDVIDAEVNYRVRYTDPKASRNQVISEIMDKWANEQWHRATMTLRGAPRNPHAAETAVAHG